MKFKVDYRVVTAVYQSVYLDAENYDEACEMSRAKLKDAHWHRQPYTIDPFSEEVECRGWTIIEELDII